MGNLIQMMAFTISNPALRFAAVGVIMEMLIISLVALQCLEAG
jgi:hypothetical protein